MGQTRVLSWAPKPRISSIAHSGALQASVSSCLVAKTSPQTDAKLSEATGKKKYNGNGIEGPLDLSHEGGIAESELGNPTESTSTIKRAAYRLGCFDAAYTAVEDAIEEAFERGEAPAPSLLLPLARLASVKMPTVQEVVKLQEVPEFMTNLTQREHSRPPSTPLGP